MITRDMLEAAGRMIGTERAAARVDLDHRAAANGATGSQLVEPDRRREALDAAGTMVGEELARLDLDWTKWNEERARAGRGRVTKTTYPGKSPIQMFDAEIRGAKRSGDDQVNSPAQRAWEARVKNDEASSLVLEDWLGRGVGARVSPVLGRKIAAMMATAPKFKGTVFRAIDKPLPPPKVGAVFTIKGPVSTTRAPRLVEEFMGLMERQPYADPNRPLTQATGTLFKMDVKRGMSVERFSAFKTKEREIVARQGRYRVAKSEQSADKTMTVIHLVEL